MFAIGAGVDSPALHHPDYNFPHELIGIGLSMFKAIVRTIIENEV